MVLDVAFSCSEQDGLDSCNNAKHAVPGLILRTLEPYSRTEGLGGSYNLQVDFLCIVESIPPPQTCIYQFMCRNLGLCGQGLGPWFAHWWRTRNIHCRAMCSLQN